MPSPTQSTASLSLASPLVGWQWAAVVIIIVAEFSVLYIGVRGLLKAWWARQALAKREGGIAVGLVGLLVYGVLAAASVGGLGFLAYEFGFRFRAIEQTADEVSLINYLGRPIASVPKEHIAAIRFIQDNRWNGYASVKVTEGVTYYSVRVTDGASLQRWRHEFFPHLEP